MNNPIFFYIIGNPSNYYNTHFEHYVCCVPHYHSVSNHFLEDFWLAHVQLSTPFLQFIFFQQIWATQGWCQVGKQKKKTLSFPWYDQFWGVGYSCTIECWFPAQLDALGSQQVCEGWFVSSNSLWNLCATQQGCSTVLSLHTNETFNCKVHCNKQKENASCTVLSLHTNETFNCKVHCNKQKENASCTVLSLHTRTVWKADGWHGKNERRSVALCFRPQAVSQNKPKCLWFIFLVSSIILPSQAWPN